jgi:cytochrome P450
VLLDEIDVLDPDLYAAGDPVANGLPHAVFDELRAHHPLHRQRLSDPGLIDWTWVVSRHADVEYIAIHPDPYSSASGVTLRTMEATNEATGGKPAMITMDGERHAVNRRVVSRGFLPAVVRALEEEYRAFTTDLLDRVLPRGTFDFVEQIATVVPMTALFDLIGAPEDDRAQLLAWSNTFANATDPELAPSIEAIVEAMNATWSYGVHLAEQKRRQPGNDLMSQVVAAFDEHSLSEDELMGMTLLLIGAGNETTRNAMSHGLHALIRHPEQWALLREQGPAIIDTAVEEILRWASPVISFRRTASRDTELHGQAIAAGDPVTFLIASANFDPAVFADPLTFDLLRSPNRHLAFGKGPHHCLGSAMARIELRILFEELAARVRSVELAGEPSYLRDSFLRGVKHLPVTVELA